MDTQVHTILSQLRNNEVGPDEQEVIQKRAADLIEDLHESLNAIPPAPDNTVRDIMAREAAHAMRTDRERALAKEDMQDDNEFIFILHGSGNERARKTARLISIAARYAGELQHTLINPLKRQQLKDAKLDGYDDKKDLWNAIREGGDSWDDIVDPGLAGNARIACQNVADALPRLHGLQVEHILSYNGQNEKELLDYFCAAVAARWRSTTVFAAGLYKTGNEQVAVRVALKEALQICRDYSLVNNNIEWCPRPKAPTCIAEIPVNLYRPMYADPLPASLTYGNIDTQPLRPYFRS